MRVQVEYVILGPQRMFQNKCGRNMEEKARRGLELIPSEVSIMFRELGIFRISEEYTLHAINPNSTLIAQSSSSLGS